MESELDRFKQALRSNEAIFDVELSEETLAQLGEYYSLLMHWNDRLHLVAPCSAQEFAVRHVLESLLLLKHLPSDARVADIGSGAGLPIIPCLIAKPDLQATLFESSQKKAIFLREVANQFRLNATVVARRFEDVEPPSVFCVTCRALDHFMEQLPALIDWAPKGSTFLLFGGESLRAQLDELGFSFEAFLIPSSMKRFIFLATA